MITNPKPGLHSDWNRTLAESLNVIGNWPFWDYRQSVATDIVTGLPGVLTNFPANPWEGGHLEFDTNDYVRTASHPAYYPAGAFTVMVWVRTVHQATFQVIFDINGNTGLSIFTQSTTQQIRIGMGGDSSALVSNADIDDGEWHSIAFVFESATFAALYIDGVFDNSDATVTAPNFGTAPVDIGSRAGAFGVFGDIDGAVYCGKALSAAEVADFHRHSYRLIEQRSIADILWAGIAAPPVGGVFPTRLALLGVGV